MKAMILVFVGAFGAAISAAEVPSVGKLAAEAFEEREAAQREIVEWVLANHEGAKEKLLAEYFKSTSPEVRGRLIPLLERAYFAPKGYVGVVMTPMTSLNFRGQLQDEEAGKGVKITEVLPGTPAAASGLQLNDVILKINDWEVQGGYDLTSKVAAEIQRHPPLAPVALKVKRGEEMIDIRLKLGILPVPSDRARELKTTGLGGLGYLPEDITSKLEEFRSWLSAEIEKERKNLVADRRL